MHRRAGNERQRHTCYKCLIADWEVLKTNPFITPWQFARIIGCVTRQYFCIVCVLEHAHEPSITRHFPRPAQCKKHSVFHEQKRCSKHGLTWTKCCECKHDLRAGTSFCQFCRCPLSHMCGCPRGPTPLIEAAKRTVNEQPEEHVRLMERLAADLIEYARRLQETLGVEEHVLRVKATFQFADASLLQSYLQR